MLRSMYAEVVGMRCNNPFLFPFFLMKPFHSRFYYKSLHYMSLQLDFYLEYT